MARRLIHFVLAIGLCACCVPAFASASAQQAPADTFVSLWPACACGWHTNLDLFSTTSGRWLRDLGSVSANGSGGLQAAGPAAANDGRLFLTLTSQAQCDIPKGKAYMECPRFVPDSCRNAVETASPGHMPFQTLFTVPGSRTIRQAVPSPDGREVAMTIAPCLGTTGITGLFVRNLKTAATRAVMTSENVCDSFGPQRGTGPGPSLPSPYEKAGGKPISMAGGIGCPDGKSRLALESAGAAARPTLISPGRGCVFGAAGFDRLGVVAVEGCNQGEPNDEGNNHLGRAFVLQYGSEGKPLRRIPLELGLEQALVAPEARTGNVLITQDQPANQGYAERDWVWEFDGHRLRAIAHYSSEDAAQVLAVPW